MNSIDLQKVLGRNEHLFDIEGTIRKLEQTRILITGANGSIGRQIVGTLQNFGISVLPTDSDSLDVTDVKQVEGIFSKLYPTHVIHLAADKHAPASEVNPEKTCRINIDGTINLVTYARKTNTKILTASTCKACDPETIYGSTKLIAERITLNNGGSVARFYNVVETSGNVFSIWNDLPKDAPIEVTPCFRYFISLREAEFLLLSALTQSKVARYSIHPGESRFIPDIAKELYPFRTIINVNPRRGDRINEPLKAKSESIVETGNELVQISSPYDQFL